LDSRARAESPTEPELREQLRSQVRRYCPRWLAADADDIAQVAWLRLSAAREKNERNRQPGASFVSRVAYCATVDEIRRHRRRREVPMDPAVEPVIARPATPADGVRSREIGMGIRDCLLKLIPNRRRAVALYLQGHSASEAGEILGWTLRKTENLIFRGMTDLRGCLSRKGVRP